MKYPSNERHYSIPTIPVYFVRGVKDISTMIADGLANMELSGLKRYK